MSDAESELRNLCDKYQSFPPEKRYADQEWLTAQIAKGKLDSVPVREFVGKIVAVYAEEVVLVGDDETAMRIELSKKYEVHPGRFVLQLISKHSIPRKGGGVRGTAGGVKEAAIGCSIIQVALVLVLCAVVGIAAISALGTKTNATFSKIGSRVE